MDESENLCFKKSLMSPPPPPPLPPSPGYGSRKIDGDSITNIQIKKFWRQKQIIEEEHLFAAIKAASRVRARNLSVRPLVLTILVRFLIHLRGKMDLSFVEVFIWSRVFNLRRFFRSNQSMKARGSKIDNCFRMRTTNALKKAWTWRIQKPKFMRELKTGLCLIILHIVFTLFQISWTI